MTFNRATLIGVVVVLVALLVASGSDSVISEAQDRAVEKISVPAVVNKNFLTTFLLVRQGLIEKGVGADGLKLGDDVQERLANGLSVITHPIAREKAVAALALQRNIRWERTFLSLMRDPSYEVRAAALIGVALLPRLSAERTYLPGALEAKSPNVSIATLFLFERHQLKDDFSQYRALVVQAGPDKVLDRALARVEAELGK